MEEQENVNVVKIFLQPEDIEELNLGDDYQIMAGKPHFFIKAYKDEKRYRISASFKHINEKWDLKINIIRDIKKINLNKILLLQSEEIVFSEKQLPGVIVENFKPVPDIEVKRLFDALNKTFLFIVTRNFEGDINTSIVFFSQKFWNINEYLKLSDYIK